MPVPAANRKPVKKPLVLSKRPAPSSVKPTTGAPKRSASSSSDEDERRSSSSSSSEEDEDEKRVKFESESESASSSENSKQDERDDSSDASPATSSGSEEEEEEEEEEEDEDDDDANDLPENPALSTVGASRFASALRAIVGSSTTVADSDEKTEAKSPSELFKRSAKMLKEARQDRQERERLRVAHQRRKSFDHKNLLVLPLSDPKKIAKERELKRIATRGVVALFNAINAHQRSLSAPVENSESAFESKDGFLEQLRKAAGSATLREEDERDHETKSHSNKRVKSSADGLKPASSGGGGGWKALQDDYLDDLEEEEEEFDEGDAD